MHMQTSWTGILSGICSVLILLILCFKLKQFSLVGYPAGYLISKKAGYPVQLYFKVKK